MIESYEKAACGIQIRRAENPAAYRGSVADPGGDKPFTGIFLFGRPDMVVLVNLLRQRLGVTAPEVGSHELTLVWSNRRTRVRHGLCSTTALFARELSISRITVYRHTLSVVTHELAHWVQMVLWPETYFKSRGAQCEDDHGPTFQQVRREIERLTYEVLGLDPTAEQARHQVKVND